MQNHLQHKKRTHFMTAQRRLSLLNNMKKMKVCICPSLTSLESRPTIPYKIARELFANEIISAPWNVNLEIDGLRKHSATKPHA